MTRRPCVWCCTIRTTPDEPNGTPCDTDGHPVRFLAPPHAECVAELETFLDNREAD